MDLFSYLVERYNIFRTSYPLEYQEVINQIDFISLHRNEIMASIVSKYFFVEISYFHRINFSNINIYRNCMSVTYMSEMKDSSLIFKRNELLSCRIFEKEMIDSVRLFCKIIGYIPHNDEALLVPSRNLEYESN